jgi:hypothetical protein
VVQQKSTRLLAEFAAIEAVVGHPPRRETIACDVQRDVWIAAAFLDVMWLQIVDRDDVDLTGSNPAGPPPIARTITADLGAVDGIDNHCRHQLRPRPRVDELVHDGVPFHGSDIVVGGSGLFEVLAHENQTSADSCGVCGCRHG